MTDIINEPPHYKSGGLEAIDVLEAFFEDDPLGWQVGKYILRYKKKNGLEDLQKAEFFLKRLMAKLIESDPVTVQPRQWLNLDAVPHDVAVLSSGGCYWSYWDEDREDEFGVVLADGEWLWTTSKSTGSYDKTGPFTEVLSDG